ncbi:MAG: OB-fold nucleic acid binding domain-containing protein [Candidatus Hadarchaeota archaeon]
MEEKSMGRISLACSIAGLAAIYAAAAAARPQLTSIASIDNNFIGLNVVISGQVMELKESRDNHLFVKLRDSSGGVASVPIFSRTRAELETIELLDVLEVRGEVTIYRNELEVVPAESSDVKVIHTAPLSISGITKENAGSPVKVQGTVAEREIVGSGSVIFTLRENGSKLPVYVSSWIVDDGIPEIHVGGTLRASGWLQLYKGELELKVAGASDLQAVA